MKAEAFLVVQIDSSGENGIKLTLTSSLPFSRLSYHNRSWMRGVVGATLQQVVTHQMTKKEEEEEEEGALTLPGRVYYIKPRKLHGGATIKEVR